MWLDDTAQQAFIRKGDDSERQCNGRVATRFQMIDCNTRAVLSSVITADGFGSNFPAFEPASGASAAAARVTDEKGGAGGSARAAVVAGFTVAGAAGAAAAVAVAAALRRRAGTAHGDAAAADAVVDAEDTRLPAPASMRIAATSAEFQCVKGSGAAPAMDV